MVRMVFVFVNIYIVARVNSLLVLCVCVCVCATAMQFIPKWHFGFPQKHTFSPNIFKPWRTIVFGIFSSESWNKNFLGSNNSHKIKTVVQFKSCPYKILCGCMPGKCHFWLTSELFRKTILPEFLEVATKCPFFWKINYPFHTQTLTNIVLLWLIWNFVISGEFPKNH